MDNTYQINGSSELIENFSKVVALHPNLETENRLKSERYTKVISILQLLKKENKAIEILLALEKEDEISISDFIQRFGLNPKETIDLIDYLSDNNLILLEAKRKSPLNIYIKLSSQAKELLDKLAKEEYTGDRKTKITTKLNQILI